MKKDESDFGDLLLVGNGDILIIEGKQVLTIGSQVYLTGDPTQRVGVIFDRTAEDYVVQYNEGPEKYLSDVPLTAVGFSDPATWHPAANLVELLPRAELFEMAEDIRKQGQLVPIVLFEGKILDGRNRLLACNLAGVEPQFSELDAVKNPAKYVNSMNVVRRQMSVGQKATYAVLLKAFYKEQAKQNQRQGGKTKVVQEIGQGRVDKIVAKEIGVNHLYVHKAQKILDASPEVFQKVHRDELTIPQAEKMLGLGSPESLELDVFFAARHLESFRRFAKENKILLQLEVKASIKRSDLSKFETWLEARGRETER